MQAKNFVKAIFGFVILYSLTYIALFFYQLHAPVGADYWVKNIYTFKEARAQRLKSPKLIVLGGSNVLFGISTEVMQDTLGIPVLNLGVHAGLDMDYLYYELKKTIKEGDTVVLSLEYEYYYASDKMTGLFVNNMMAWDKTYIYQLPFKKMIELLITAEPKRVIAGVLTQIKSYGLNSKIKTEEQMQKELNKTWATGDDKWLGYTYISINKYGDINVNEDVLKSVGGTYIREEALSAYFLEIYQKIYNLVLEKNGKLILVHPVTMRSKDFNLETSQSKKIVDDITKTLMKEGVKLECSPALFHFERTLFFDTNYHLNKNGARIRSENLAWCLQNRKDTFGIIKTIKIP